MGSWLSTLFRSRETRILMVGLDAAGKTSILYKLRLNELVTTIPTIGFNVETVDYKNVHFTVWDVGGQDAIRPLWRHYYQNSEAVVFVVDANDQGRFAEARGVLDGVLASDELAGVPVLVFANKSDLPQAASAAEVVDALGLSRVKRRAWFCQRSCATNGDGLYEGLDWLASKLA